MLKRIPLDATYNIVVRGDSASSTVRVTVLWVSAEFSKPATTIDCSTTGRWESDLEGAVKAKAETVAAR
ncbi:MAG TPA: hypothetical protein VJR24_07885 [Gemmatimonadaceae bacterium]|nr:hypothetical protein [Gemmatimonadaceae bacterium]